MLNVHSAFTTLLIVDENDDVTVAVGMSVILFIAVIVSAIVGNMVGALLEKNYDINKLS